MNVNIIRSLDEYFGGMICFLLSIFKTKKKPVIHPKKFLIIKIWGIGSIINLTPVISEIKNKVPNSKIYLLTMRNNKGLYDSNKKEIDRVYYINLRNIFTSFINILKVMIDLRKEKIDTLIDFEISSNTTPIMSFFIRPTVSISYKTGKFKDRLFDILVRYKEDTHITEIFKEPLKPLGIFTNEYSFIEPNVSQRDINYVKRLLKEADINKYVIVNINASNVALERKLPMNKFIDISKYLTQKYKRKIVLIGSVYERNIVEEFKRKLKGNVYNFAGKTNLAQLAYLIKKAELMVTNDSGPLHLATIMDTKTISFFGPESPIKYGPKGEKHIILYNNFSCSPCMNVFKSKRINCKNNVKCLKRIKTEDIKKAIDKQLVK